jgi:photosystem II stability/assembly factor-like uncharacterized protein
VNFSRPFLSRLSVLLLAAGILSIAEAQQFSSGYFQEMRWRMIGPHRAGRTRAVAGVPSQPNVFYIGVVNGGVWKSTDYGVTWRPIFDDQPTGSIGSIAVSPSNPDIIYVGSGEGLQRPDLSWGDGIYKSTDAGKTWTHLGLRDAQQIPQVSVDPRDPNRVFVAALGHPYGPNEERGIYRSTDGGQSFQKVLGKDENTGGCDVEIDPSNPQIVYAAMWEARQGPWENAAWSGTSGGIFKSTDGGSTWRQLTKGLPIEGVVQANLDIAPSDTKRLYASVASPGGVGVYRSDDAGESWTRITTDSRPAGRIGGGDLPVPEVHPENPDIVFMASTVSWKSTDGGKTWAAFRGAPGGDDYQHIWINPLQPDTMLFASDQGAIITVNGGRSWSSWYNQPTAQLYHVSADNAFPYRVCGGQQESGSVCISSRGNDGQITFREWHPVGVEEYGYVAPDPLNPDIVYGGKVSRYDRRTGQVQNIAPKPIRPPGYRVLRTMPVLFSPVDPRTLFFASNTLWKTIDGGRHWQEISADLTRKTWEIPASVGKYRSAPTAQPSQRGVIYTVAPSPLDANRIWAGTDDGLIHVTTDGGLTWRDVTPPQLTPWAKVSILDAGHFDPLVAYAAINTIRLDDPRPHILRTRDGGETWVEITTGIPANENVNAVREDPVRKGLLFAGTERAVHVSFDDGEHWQSLRLNMPATSIRDLIVKDDDLVVGTHGRSFWILDDITPLRQLDAAAADKGVILFRPQTAIRVRWNMNTDTPLPPDEPAGQNPPDGAIINYFLKSPAAGPVTLEILDATGKLVRRYSSADPVEPPDPMLAVPPYWVRPPRALPAQAGMHRFLWDMRYTPLPGIRPSYPIAAIFQNTPPAPASPWVLPGKFTVKLTVDGQSYTQPLTVKMDPRVKTPLLGLQQQFTLSKQAYDDIVAASAALTQLRALRAQLAERRNAVGAGAVADAIAALDQKAESLTGRGGGPGGGGPPFGGAAGQQDTLAGVSGSLRTLMNLLQNADVTPTAQAVAGVGERHKVMTGLLSRWKTLKSKDLPDLNARLKSANLPPIAIE